MVGGCVHKVQGHCHLAGTSARVGWISFLKVIFFVQNVRIDGRAMLIEYLTRLEIEDEAGNFLFFKPLTFS